MTDQSIPTRPGDIQAASTPEARTRRLIAAALELPLRTAVTECSRGHWATSLAAFKWAMDTVRANPALRIHGGSWTYIDRALTSVHREPYKRTVNRTDADPNDVFYSTSVAALSIECCTEALKVETAPAERSKLFRRRAEMRGCGKTMTELEAGEDASPEVKLVCEDQKNMFLALKRDIPADCAVCLEPLDIGIRARAILPCFHALCVKCSEGVMRTAMYAKKPRPPTCPECRKPFTA